jgi:hypothetical protein
MAVVLFPRRDLVHDFTYLSCYFCFLCSFGFPFGIRLVQRAQRAHIRGWLHLLYLLQSVASVGYFPLTLPRDREREIETKDMGHVSDDTRRDLYMMARERDRLAAFLFSGT